jgi:hypothetical protein
MKSLVPDIEDGEMYGSPIPAELKIPSDFIEPYVQRFLMMCLEELAYFTTPVSEVKARLDGVRRFVSFTSGVHASIACDNAIRQFTDTPDEELKAIAVKIFKS